MSPLDRNRAQRLMQEAGIDALLLTQPENVTYATGGPPGVAASWRKAGAAMALVPAEADARSAAIVGDLQAPQLRAQAGEDLDLRTHPIWVDFVDLSAAEPGSNDAARAVDAAYAAAAGGAEVAPRPATFDPRQALGELRALLAERGMARARLGVELGFIPAADLALFQAELPGIAWVDATRLVERLRAVKSPAEIAHLREACRLAEAGLVHLRDNLRPGLARGAVAALWVEGAIAAAGGRLAPTEAKEFISVDADPWSGGGVVTPGVPIKADVACRIAGYSSDSARTFCVGPPSPLARGIFAALRDAFAAGIASFRPGVPLAAVHAEVTATMRRAGFTRYNRGHFGHGIGASVWGEEWPYIAASSTDVPLEPGMVLAFETPFYAKGLGALMIEDQFVVTDTGIEVMNTLPRDLVVL